jgi:signal transduction histidine kinase
MSALPAEPRQLSCSVEELRTLFLFEKLSDDQLQWLCERGHVQLFEPGTVYAEGAPATCFYVLLDGTVVLSRRVGADDIEVGRTSTRGVYTGAFMAYLGESVPQVYNNSVRVTEPSRFFVLDASAFAQLMQDWFPMAVHLLEGLFFGNKNAQAAIGQRERLLALGSLSAGLTHELNNPAAAAVRATSSLRERVAGMRHKLGMIAGGKWDRTMLQTLIRLQEEAAERVPKAPVLSPLEASDAEDAITDWLDSHQVRDGWDMAPTFVAAGLDVAWLDRVEATVDPGCLEAALRWLNYTIDTELLMNEIEDSTTRISTLVGAAKQYSQLDRAPYQVVDVHELLDSTLMMLSGKIPPGITVVKVAAADTGVRRRAEPGLDEPDRQRGVRDERDRDADGAHRKGPGGRGVRGVRRHRARGPARDQEPHIRAVLHHQAGGRGNRSRAGYLVAHRGEEAPWGPVTGVVAGRHAVPGTTAGYLARHGGELT